MVVKRSYVTLVQCFKKSGKCIYKIVWTLKIYAFFNMI